MLFNDHQSDVSRAVEVGSYFDWISPTIGAFYKVRGYRPFCCSRPQGWSGHTIFKHLRRTGCRPARGTDQMIGNDYYVLVKDRARAVQVMEIAGAIIALGTNRRGV